MPTDTLLGDKPDLFEKYQFSSATEIYKADETRVYGVAFNPDPLHRGEQSAMKSVLMGQVQTKTGDQLTSISSDKGLDEVVKALNNELSEDADTYVVSEADTVYHGFSPLNKDLMFDAQKALEYTSFLNKAHTRVPRFINGGTIPSESSQQMVYERSLNRV